MTFVELLVLEPGLLVNIQNEYEHRLNMLSDCGTDEQLDLMEEVLADLCINDLSGRT